jgi:glycerol-3-phosphate acyltransferase PlsX
MLRIAVDAMGGDHAPAVVVEGALAAARHLDVRVLLVGPESRVTSVLRPLAGGHTGALEVIDAEETVSNDEPAALALRRRPRAAIRIAAELVAAGEADALVSAGHTGATVVSARTAFGMIPGVDRPALAAVIPTQTGSAVLIDAGASVECRPAHLVQFAVMGEAYARHVLGIERPRVALVSIGEEPNKGNELTREAHRLLKTAPVGFIGNVEGREIYSGAAEVIVCDGFTGNVVLKTSEGLVDAVERLLGDELRGTFTSQMGSVLSRRAFRRFRRRVDYSEYGGAPLLGVAGTAIVAHGRSSAKAVRNAIAMAARLASSDVVSRVTRGVAVAGVS